MDKKDKKAVEDAIKNSLMPGMGSNPSSFFDAASLLGKWISAENIGRLSRNVFNKIQNFQLIMEMALLLAVCHLLTPQRLTLLIRTQVRLNRLAWMPVSNFRMF